LPRPLNPQDVTILRRSFSLQADGHDKIATEAISQLDGSLLLGTVLANQYLGHAHRSTTAELTAWLARYGDLPDAPAIRDLLVSKLPRHSAPPPTPSVSMLPPPTTLTEPVDQWRSGIERNAGLDQSVIDLASNGHATKALRQVAVRKGIQSAYAALLRAEIAQQMFLQNDDEGALRLALSVLSSTTSNDQPGLAYYIGGLAAWRLDRRDLAFTLFQGGATARIASPAARAAAALWAARAARAQNDPRGMVVWLQQAAGQPTTFHGQIARRMLRMDLGSDAPHRITSQADVDAVAATLGGMRAFALLQVDQTTKAEAEFRALWPQAKADPVFGRALMMVASNAGMDDLAAQLAELLHVPSNAQPALPRFPVPRLQPRGGFQVDPPLVYALARVESNFNSEAISAVGALGMMQIMPDTARYLMGSAYFTVEQLHEPASNLAIGQRYLQALAKLDGIDGNLMKMLASYNAGPGNLQHWAETMRDQGDPLLFIETIPVAETRNFVPQALSYAWLYAAQMRLPSPSLDAIAGGLFPRFTPAARERKMAAMEPATD
jgi:soluble lytic murein transglycosylase